MDSLPIVYMYCSLDRNNIGDEGGKAIGDALKTNTTLRDLKYVHLHLCVLSMYKDGCDVNT